ncbi:MAG: AraC family transcriptional regulator, partial [Verrucomicrobiota bacterium]
RAKRADCFDVAMWVGCDGRSAKDLGGRFVFVNQSLLRALGIKDIDQLLGHDDFDLFDPKLAEQYQAEDRLVITTGSPITNQVWLVPHPDGTLHWYLSSKSPLRDPKGEVIGVAGIMRDFDHAGELVGPYRELSPAITYAQNHYCEAVSISDLAKETRLSVSTLERRFKSLFKISPSTYLIRLRLHRARRLLSETTDPISEIATECGFYDQSHFTKIFRREVGMTPKRFRNGDR